MNDRDTLLRIADSMDRGMVTDSEARITARHLRAIASRLPGPYSPEPPREPGEYWCIDPKQPDKPAWMCSVYRTEYGMAARRDDWIRNHREFGGYEWSGPIAPPEVTR